MNYKSVLFLFSFLLSVLSAAAVRSNEPVSEIRFRTLAVSGNIEGVYFRDGSGAQVELKAVDYVRSPIYRAAPGGPLVIYRLLPPLEGETEPVPEVLERIDWPARTCPFLLLVGTQGDSFSFSLTPDDTGTFPMGSFRIYNTSALPVVIQVGDVMAQLVPGESKVLNPDFDPEGRGALFQVAARVGDEPRIVYSNLWNSSQTQRTLVFIHNRNNPRAPIGLKRLHESEMVLRREQRSGLEGQETD